MKDYLNKVIEAVSYINERIFCMPEIAVILGSGLGSLADEVTDRIEIPYNDIPNFPASKVIGHENKLIIGKIYNRNVIMMQGRFHYYEGYEMDEVAFPIKVFAMLGVKKLIVSNAAGGINKKLKRGDIMLITDHINTFGNSPLRGENIPEFGVRFPGMRGAYSSRLIQIAKEQVKQIEAERALDKNNSYSFKNNAPKNKAETKEEKLLREEYEKIDQQLEDEYAKLRKSDIDMKIELKEGVYAFMPGPQYETEAEIKMLTIIGADAVGMSTVPEVISAVHSGIEVLGISCITDECYTDVSPSHDKVVEVANNASQKLKLLVMKIIRAM